MPGAGPRLFGRELDLPETAVTVRVRHGRTELTEGPLSEAGDLLSGLDVIECADLGLALAWLAEQAPEHSADTPYLLLGWVGRGPAPAAAERGLIDEIEAWRRDLDRRGLYVMGSAFGGIEATATLRLRDARSRAADSPFTEVDHQTFTIDVVLCAERRAAIARAATHPLTPSHAVEVRPFSGRA